MSRTRREIDCDKYLYVLDDLVCRGVSHGYGESGGDSPRVAPQSGNWAPRGVYAIPQNACLRAGFFWKLVGSLGFVPGGVLLDEDELLFFFESTTPRVTPTAMRTASPNTEPMTCDGGSSTDLGYEDKKD